MSVELNLRRRKPCFKYNKELCKIADLATAMCYCNQVRNERRKKGDLDFEDQNINNINPYIMISQKYMIPKDQDQILQEEEEISRPKQLEKINKIIEEAQSFSHYKPLKFIKHDKLILSETLQYLYPNLTKNQMFEKEQQLKKENLIHKFQCFKGIEQYIDEDSILDEKEKELEDQKRIFMQQMNFSSSMNISNNYFSDIMKSQMYNSKLMHSKSVNLMPLNNNNLSQNGGKTNNQNNNSINQNGILVNKLLQKNSNNQSQVSFNDKKSQLEFIGFAEENEVQQSIIDNNQPSFKQKLNEFIQNNLRKTNSFNDLNKSKKVSNQEIYKISSAYQTKQQYFQKFKKNEQKFIKPDKETQIRLKRSISEKYTLHSEGFWEKKFKIMRETKQLNRKIDSIELDSNINNSINTNNQMNSLKSDLLSTTQQTINNQQNQEQLQKKISRQILPKIHNFSIDISKFRKEINPIQIIKNN